MSGKKKPTSKRRKKPKGLNRKDAPECIGAGYGAARYLRIWAFCGIDLRKEKNSVTANLVALYDPNVPMKQKDFAVRLELTNKELAIMEARALHEGDSGITLRLGLLKVKIGQAVAGSLHDPKGYIIAREYYQIALELASQAMEQGRLVIPDFEKGIIYTESYNDAMNRAMEQSPARLIPTRREVMGRCEKDPQWPKGKAGRAKAKHYFDEIVGKFGLRFERVKPGPTPGAKQ